MPAVSVSPPVNVLVPDSTSVAPLSLKVNPPDPLSTPDSVSVVPLFGLRVPPPSVTFRAELNVAVVTSVPPLSVTAFAAAPRFVVGAHAAACRP